MRTQTTKLPADLDTPVGLYMKIRDLYPQSVILESSDYHTSQNSVSLIGVDPIGHFKVHQEVIEKLTPDGKLQRIEIKDGRLVTEELKKYIESFSDLKLGENLTNGILGYTSYDAVRYFEPAVHISNPREEFAHIPDMLYILFRYVIQVNHFKNEMTVIENIPDGDESRMHELVSVLKNKDLPHYAFSVKDDRESKITDEDFLKIVKKCIDHCRRGDVFQIVPSRCFSEGYTGDDFNAYRALRSVNPSPYLFYFDMGSFRIFGSSPETHLRVKGNKAWIDPIAGTFRRTGNDERDKELAESLLTDEKENAEHIMLVDLARNDLSRTGGKVEIDFLKQIQFYSHVIHMVSRVIASLPEDADVYELFAKTFPAGTLTGAPKVRAMQIIDEIEPHARKIYGGCIGYFGFDGSLNQAITIRTFVSTNSRLYSQSGGGVVAHSVPESELQETKNKLGALRSALEKASEFNF